MTNSALFLILRRMRLPFLVLIAAYSISMLGLVLIPGLDNQGNPHQIDLFHAFYIVTYTVTTIGFGELPYTFTAAQRLWMIASIYLGVVAWLYAIGTFVSLLQDSAFRQVIKESRFTASVRRITEPFFIVCGFGDTGNLVVRAMVRRGFSVVVVDNNQDRINELLLENLRVYVPGLCADAMQPGALIMAGLKHPSCLGVVALTNQDKVNLKVAITSRLLSPSLTVICRAQTHDTEANMYSFGTDAVINPFDTFARRLAMAMHSPDLHMLNEWLTGVPRRSLPARIDPPHGNWVLCGYGRFGKAVNRYLQYEGIPTVIIEADPEGTRAPQDAVIGRGTEAVTLREAHIEDAVGIVAGTDDDSNNLSILITARDLNPRLFMIGRQNARENQAIFEAAKLDLVMQRARIMASEILSRVTTPLLTEFLHYVRQQTNDWARNVIARLRPIIGERVPELWPVRISQSGTPAVTEFLQEGQAVRLGNLQTDPRDRTERLACLPLLLVRNGEQKFFPDEDMLLQEDDHILFCGTPLAANRIQWTLNNLNALSYSISGQARPDGYVWRLLACLRDGASKVSLRS